MHAEAGSKELGGVKAEGKGAQELGQRDKSRMPNQGKEGTVGDAEKLAGLGCMLSEWLLDSLSMRQPSKSFAERARPGLAQVKLENLISTVAVA